MAAEHAADEARAELESACQNHASQVQLVRSAAERRAASATADIAVLERALEASSEARREADNEARSQLAISSERERTTADLALSLEAQVCGHLLLCFPTNWRAIHLTLFFRTALR